MIKTGIARQRNIVVGISEMGLSGNPNESVTTYSLGSCLAVAIYDPVVRVGGILHAMLPTCAQNSEKALSKPAMFVDSGVPALFRAAYRLGAVKERIIIKAAGGAEILTQDHTFGIGRRNFEVLLEILDRNRVTLTASAVGGRVSRTMRLDLATGSVSITIIGQPVLEL